MISSRLSRATTYLILTLGLVLALGPLLLMLLNAFKPTPQIITSPLSLPTELDWSNFTRAWSDARLGETMLNSAKVTVMTIILVLTTASGAAYVLARQKIKRWKSVSAYFLATTTAPIQLFLFPLYFGFARAGWINNPIAVSFIYCAMFSPFAIMLLRTYFIAIPKELEEAAALDGTNQWRLFWRVMLPIVSPGLLTVALIIGLYCWNEFLIASTFLQAKGEMTAVVAFTLLSGQYSSDWGEIMAAAVIIVLPILMLFVLLQRHFIDGMAGGSTKG
ncbi:MULTISPECIES: carbohydrate ABC transporter permease [unclassified Devosia]|uniref:carbohydrate ABC transporter permease n=1 Tax=unclassified Devosia TaxID=196773 RepID=UPI00086D855B|nr:MULTISPECIES: carbohydrate ABC transporter permease [unclassified Devosia]MBN9363560.1 carbohydrate ABC transporter permease [Devosia sp.]ODS81518.1 MAG: sugar ABC transporter permease [Devosia sp. SCN 66-27]OJX25368.1 MAG: sugar ABC transporter permease [Devosia sp. 66-14]